MKRAEVTVTNAKAHQQPMNNAVYEVLSGKVAAHVKSYLRQLLGANIQADGSPRPASPPAGQKYESTKKAYKRKGWDTEHYLVATGASTKLESRMIGKKTLEITPANPTILGYHIPENERYRGEMTWMELNQSEQDTVMGIIRERIKRALR